MRIALIASPFISVPPVRYGGTELFIAHLARGLKKLGIDVVVYTNGESTLDVETRWLYANSEWPLKGEIYASLKDINHAAWAIRDCFHEADIVHMNNAPGLALSRFAGPRFAYTMHHSHSQELTDFYTHYPDVEFVTISRFQQAREPLRRIRTIHHGVDLDCYSFQPKKQDYLAFLGRIAPVKGAHTAIEIAQKAGIPLKLAGEVQPMYREYFEQKIKPHIDGKFVEYVGEADLAAKNEVLGNAMALLFPIEWDEPFGLVMIEAMACGTPVLAFPGGSVEEIVKDDVSGFMCHSADEMVARIKDVKKLKPQNIRTYVQQCFSVEKMVKSYASLYAGMMHDSVVRKLADEPEEPRAIA